MATTPGHVGGVGFSAVFGPIGAVALLTGIRKNIGRHQIANFFGIVCDQVGLPREIPKGREDEFPVPDIAMELKRDAFGIRECGWIRARINRENLRKLNGLIEDI